MEVTSKTLRGNITRHYIEAAKKQGMPEITTSCELVHVEGKDYRISYLQEDGSNFSIYDNGEYDYNGDICGKLMRPHDKRWVKKLVKEGTPVPFAKAECAEFYSLRFMD